MPQLGPAPTLSLTFVPLTPQLFSRLDHPQLNDTNGLTHAPSTREAPPATLRHLPGSHAVGPRRQNGPNPPLPLLVLIYVLTALFVSIPGQHRFPKSRSRLPWCLGASRELKPPSPARRSRSNHSDQRASSFRVVSSNRVVCWTRPGVRTDQVRPDFQNLPFSSRSRYKSRLSDMFRASFSNINACLDGDDMK
ncbi:hypothetical protein CRG98_022530 [Punica granatum]|uniref:Uncharacterized protein n=1 Tax=Punica granatum TaxID=22663 RepID=A0A2I0JNB2_PUNGR|nr:hypothetical protein CRG98_022530 [Punica granatum]